MNIPLYIQTFFSKCISARPLSHLARPVQGVALLIPSLLLSSLCSAKEEQFTAGVKPKAIVFIYADDVGYGDLGCYGAKAIPTPQLDKLAREGIRFTQGYSSSATCTPSRYALMTGRYPWRKKGTGILPGDAALILPTQEETQTLPSIMKEAGYKTGIIGKWHLGLGSQNHKLDWNKEIRPGPKEVGFDESFIIPATADRVPCVFLRNGKVDKLDPQDPIEVSYKKNFAGQETGDQNPEKLRYPLLAGHGGTIVNGISRIGFMKGGKAALWKDQDMADTLTNEAINFINRHKNNPFFLFFATSDIHAPRDPHARFLGKSTCGIRGDVTVQLDDCIGRIRECLKKNGLENDTLLIFSSDNGPVVRVGYEDHGVRDLGDHKPAGPFRGMKGSAFEGGCRLPFIVWWPKAIKPAICDSLVSQMDIAPTLATLLGVKLKESSFPDACSALPLLKNPKAETRSELVLHNGGNVLAYREGDYKLFFETNKKKNAEPKLYHLGKDPSESTNIANEHPEIVKRMSEKLQSYYDIMKSSDPVLAEKTGD